LPNVLFLQSAVEDLPPELHGLASEIVVNFPWGSLLRVVGGGDIPGLSNLRRICTPGARLKLTVGLDVERDRTEIERMQLPTLSLEYVNSTLAPHYRAAGFEIVERRALSSSDWSELQTSWAKRLKSNARRSVIYILARAVEIG
jgi:16S rRNA (adenine(1408)-N(1))-methyltransferase